MVFMPNITTNYAITYTLYLLDDYFNNNNNNNNNSNSNNFIHVSSP